MIMFVLVFVNGFMHILGRPSNEIVSDTNVNLLPQWPRDENMFLLPRKFNLDEEINVTISAKNSTHEMNITLNAENQSTDNTPIVTCNFNANTGILKLHYMNVHSRELTYEEMSIDDCIAHSPINGYDYSFNIQFKRRKNVKTNLNNVLKVACVASGFATSSNEIEVYKLSKIQYLQISGEKAKVTSLQFEFIK